MGYADLASAKAQLSLDDTDADDANRIVILMECDAAMSLAFEAKAGFDVAYTPIWRGADADVDPIARTVYGDGGYLAGGFWNWIPSMLTLPAAATITDVQIAGEYPETLTTDDWLAWNASLDGPVRQIRRLDGAAWPSRLDGRTYVTVTAHWADGPRAEDAPAAVVNACTFLAVEEYRMRVMSPAGELGPDGLSIRPRNPWNYTIVTTALEAVRPVAPMAVF